MLGLLVLAAAAGWLSYAQTREAVYRVETDRVLATARLLAEDQEVQEAYALADPAQVLQPLALEAAGQAEVSWVTFLAPDGTRLSHWLPDWVGTHYPGRIEPALAGTAFVETSTTGTAGPSVRAVVPIRSARTQPGAEIGPAAVVGVVSVGQRVSELDIVVRAQVPTILGLAALVGTAGALASVVMNRYLDRTTFGLGPEQLAENFTFLDTALHNVNVGIVLLSPGGRLGLYNDRAAELLGLPAPYGSPAPVRDRAVRVDELDLPGPLAELFASRREVRDELFTAGDRVLVVNQQLTSPTPRTGLLPWRPAGVGDDDNGTVVTLYDRTDVQEMNRELESTRSLTDALRAQTHEHANRLHTVLSLLEIGRADEARGLLTDGLQAVGSPIGDQPHADAEPAVTALLLAKSAQARERGVRMDHRLEIDEPTGLAAQDLVTLLGNLLDNAIDAVTDPTLPAQDRWVEAEVRLEDGWLTLQVADGGPGPSAEDREHIFDLGWSTKPAGPAGRGVGLALVRQTARHLGGDVELVQDSGTVFTVEVPARRGAASGQGSAGLRGGADG